MLGFCHTLKSERTKWERDKTLAAQGFEDILEASSSHRGVKQRGDKVPFVFTKVPAIVECARVRRGRQVRKCKIKGQRMQY